MTTPASRIVNVAPERLATWLSGFALRHGSPVASVSDEELELTAPDGATARVRLLWGPLPDVAGEDLLEALVAAHLVPRRVGGLIVRRKAHAAGVFLGSDLVAGRHGSHYVQGRTKAGGWSQQRYARRRANQTDRSFAAAAADAAAVLMPELDRLEALAVGGERSAVASVLAQPELAPLAGLHRLGTFAVPDPNAGVLAGFGEVFRRVPIELNELA